MAEPKVVATVVRVEGQVFARNADGEVRILKEGDTLREGEVVVTATGGRVELAYADGGGTSIPAESSVLISEEMTDSARPDARSAAIEDATIAQVIQAIETGQNLDEVLEDPAAGLAGGGGGEGSNFVRLLRISEGVDGAEFEFAGARAGSIPEFEGDTAAAAATQGATGPAPAPVELSLALVAPALTNDNTPTITGSTNAPAGSQVTVVITDANGVSQTVVVTVDAQGGFQATPGAPLADGSYVVVATVVDGLGNTAAGEANGAVDTTAAPPVIVLDTDTGASGTDGITKTGTYTVTGTESGALVEYSTDGGTTWSTIAPTAVEGENTIQVRQTDVAGNVSAPATLTFTLDTTIAAPTIALDTDTGASGTDGITKTGAYTVGGTEAGALVEYSTDGGVTWTTSQPTAVEGENTIQVRQTDVAGNVSAPATLTFTLDTTIATPTIALDTDTGASGTDGITKTGAYTVTGTESGALVEYSTDGGTTWSTTAPTAVEGENTIQVRQTDVAGNVSAPATLTFTLDTTISTPTIALDADTGVSGTDGITKTGAYTVGGTEAGALVEYSTDGGVTWTTTQPVAVEGANTIQVRQTDVAGNVSAPATLTFTLDTTIAAPTIALDADTGTSGTDGITKTGAYTVTGTESGALVEYSADGGTTWSTTAPVAVEGENTIQVRQTDVAGNVSAPATLTFTLDTQIAAPTIALDTDTGASGTDGITKTGTYTVTGTESGALVEYSTDGGVTWTTTQPAAVEGANTIQVRQTDVAGNVSAPATLTFTLDTTISTPTIALDADTGVSGTDGITKTGAYTVGGTEAGALVEYSTDGGVTWTTTQPAAVEGANTIQVRQTDVAGNVSAPATLTFTLDTQIATPTIALDTDTGASGTDGITKTGAYTVGGTEAGALIEYSTDGGATWTTTQPAAVEGENTIQVRQTDVAGNVSPAATLSFTLDTQIAAPTIALDTDTGASGTDGITKTGTYTVTGTESGALVEYSTDGGVTWTTAQPTAVEGENTIQVRQTDVAGNVSAPATLTFTLDTQIAAPTIALDTDSGASGTDGITKTGAYTVGGTEAGALVEYSTDGGVTWTTAQPTAVEGENTIQVRQTDVAGNVSPAATLSFTLDTQIAAPTIALDTDTGTSGTDGITKTGAYTVGGTEAGALIEYSTDGGATWTTTQPTAVEGENTIQVRQTDVAGNVSPAATLTFTLDTTIAAPTIALDADTGTSGTDGITKTGAYTVGGTEAGALVEYSTDGGVTWSTTAPVAVEGQNTIQVRQTDVAGNVSPAATLSFTLDTQIAAPTIALDTDTGASGTDGITKTGAYTVGGTEAGALVEYSTDGGVTWTTTQPTAVEGENTIQVRQTDVAGNVSAPATLTFTLDTTIAAPTIALDTDTGASGTDGITKTGAYTVTGTESGALVEYSTDGGATWTTAQPTAVEGENTIQVRQTDVAGNVSPAATLSFTLDTQIAAPTIALDTDTGASGTDGITKTGAYTVTGTDSGALVEYSTDGGATWTTAQPTAVEGENTIQVRQTDVAGNVSAPATLTFTLDTQIATPTIALDADTGVSGTDGITKTGAYTVGGTEAGALVEYSTDGGTTWSTTAPVAVEGENTIQVRQTDVAGNVSAPATLTFTLDTTIAAPTIALDTDTGASGTDGITKTGAYTVTGTESGALVEYSTDGGTTWSTTAPVAVEGENTIQVRQTDVAGNVSAPATLTFTLDTTIATPTIALDTDTGTSGTDGITKTGAYTVTGTESGALVEYSTDGGTTWSTTAPVAVEGANTIQVRQTDVAGNVSPAATLSFTLDTQIAAPTIALDTDTGASGTDGITKTGAYTVGGTEAGALVEYSTDGGVTWTTTQPAAVEGENTIQVRQTDVAGNVSAPATLTFTLDTQIAAPTIALDADTGASGTDGITKTGTYTVTGTESGALVEYSTDGGTTWSTTAPVAVEGENTIQVRQTDVAGNVSAPATLTFTLDTQIAAPTIALDADTGASGTDGITKTGTYTVTGTESGALVEYSTDGGTTWSTTAPVAVEGENTIQVRQTDVAGNVSAPATLTFTLDTQIATPTIALDADTGVSGTDGITKTGAYTVGGTEAGALVEYSTDGGTTWSTTAPVAVEGENTIQVRQTDVAGNVSAPATLTFTLDTTIAAPTIALDTDTGASGTDGITKTGAYTVTGTESGALVEYSTDGGTTWSTTAPVAVEGENTIQVRQTDVAGNVSPAATLTFTLDTTIAAPTIALDADTGTSGTDGITKTGAYTVTGTESGALVEYSADGGTTWSTTAPVAVEGENTIQVRQTDVAGNVSAPATLTFTLDTQIAAPTIALDGDTGASGTDGITKTGTYTVTGTESGALVEYSTDGGATWTTAQPTAVEGENTIQVRQTDVAGNVSAPATLTFTLDTTISTPTIALDADTGVSGTDGITKTGAYTVGGTEAGALVEYSTDGGVTWTTTQPAAVEGANTIQVRQTDVAGNVSPAATLTFTLDTTIATPTIALDTDTGASGTDGITKTGAYTVGGTEAGALIEYSTDGGVTWTTSQPTAVEGENTIQVRQTDVAGNVSAPATLTFTLDTQIATPTIALDTDTGTSGTDGITKTGAYTVTGTESGALVEYSTDGGTTWSTTAPTAVEGENTIQVRQTDAAGNVSSAATLSFTLDTTASISIATIGANGANVTALPISGATTGIEAGQTVTLVITDQDPATPNVTVTAVVGADGSYSTVADLSALVDGPLTVTAMATDLAGNVATANGAGLKAIADAPILAPINDIFILTPGDTVISTGGADAVVIPGLNNSGSGVLQADLERELGLPSGYLDNRFNPSGPNVTHNGSVNVIDGKVTESHYALTAGATVSWDYVFTNGENLTSEVSSGFNDLVVLVVTDPEGQKQSILINASEVKFPEATISDSYTFTAASSGQYSFQWLVLNGRDRLKDSSVEISAPSFGAPGDAGVYGAPVRLPVFAELADKSGSETLSVVVSGVPSGARFTSGTFNGDGSWSFTAAELGSLLLMPPAGFSGTFALTVTATALESANGDTAVTQQVVNVTLDQTDSTHTTATGGSELINGTAGDDLIRGYAGSDTINALEGDDLVFGGADNDTLRGGTGNDWLYGGQGNDKVYGDAGEDALVGGAGNDELYGGAGADVFKWQLGDQGSASAPAVDVVKDFSVAEGDVLDLRDLLIGEAHQGVDPGNLADYLDFNFEPGSGGSVGTTVVSVKTQGAAMSSPDQIIRLENVDLLEGLTDDGQIIQKLLSNGRLITD